MWLVEHLAGEGVPEEQRHPLTTEVFREAARTGDLPLLQRLRQHGCPWDSAAWEGAVEGGCEAASIHPSQPCTYAFPGAVQEGAVEAGCEAVLEWLHEAGCPLPFLELYKRADVVLLEALPRWGVPYASWRGAPRTGREGPHLCQGDAEAAHEPDEVAFPVLQAWREDQVATPLPVAGWLVRAWMLLDDAAGV